MRILVIILLVVNVLVFGMGIYAGDILRSIQSYIESNDEVDPASASGGHVMTNTTPDTVTPPATPAATNSTNTPNEVNSTNATPDTAPLITETTANETANAQKPAVAVESKPAPRANTFRKTTETTAQIAPKPVVAPVKRLACVEIGPISKTKMAELRKIVGPLPKDSKIRIYARASNLELFWVYLPAAKTLGEQQQQITMLKRKGIQDYLIVQNASHEKGAVSLGVFKSQELAKNLQKQLADQGIPAKIGQKTTDMSYIRITQAPEHITSKYNIIRRKFPTAHTIGSCQS